MNDKPIRRSAFVLMYKLIGMLGNLFYIMILAFVNGTVGNLCAMGVTVSGACGIAKALGENIPLSYSNIIIIAMSCGVMRGILRYFEQYSNHYIAFKLLAVIRDKVFGALRRLCPAKLETKEKGSIIAMITSDIETLEVFYAHIISPFCIAVLVSLTVLIFVGNIASWYLSGVCLTAYLLIGVMVPWVSSKRLKEFGIRYRKEFSDFNAFFLDSIKGVKDIVCNGAQNKRSEDVNRRSDNLLTETKNLKKESAKSAALTELMVSVSIFMTLVCGIILVGKNIVTVGYMIIGVVAVFSSFGPVIAISALPGNLTQTFASADRITDLLEEEPVVESIEDGEKIVYEKLDVKNVSFSYDHNIDVLNDINMHAKKGEIIGIVDPSGCGKSTLLTLLIRFFSRDSGVLSYNDIDIDQIQSDNFLDNVSMVSQSTYLFDDSIEENLLIAKPDVTQEEIREACRMASVDDFIMTLADGYQSRVGMLGENMSAGEKQRLGLARAFLKGAGCILLDEPTSNVDSINEGIILNALKKQKKKKTIILVSHRESTMAIVDRLYRIEGGRMYEN